MMEKVPKKKTVSFHFSLAMFTLLFKHDLVTQALVRLCMVWFKAMWFGAVWFGTSYANLDNLAYLSTKFKGKNLVLHLSTYSNFFTF
jgi:hypothetical protein